MGLSQNRGAAINVTPLIDVLLVLLVIFLIVMPSITTFEEVHTPPPPDAQGQPGDISPHLVVRVRADLSVVLVDDDQQIEVPALEMSRALRAHLRETTHVVFIELDEAVPWNEVVSTVDTIHGIAPSTQVALMTGDR
ncbi:MAG TPA: biopolymer transporter ExbD [Kofleriaceae bacterium]|jgi:biopolymer transport protein ExbD|nr:biopolymer transporter ExbD [Kofleriaceae bacterium]